MTPPNAYFSCSNMHSYYGESYIVQGVGFQIQKGEIVALLGRNGAGKTSTLRSIARLDAPKLQQGEIWLDGQPLHTMSAYQASRLGVGLVPEDRRIIPSLTVEENLQLAQIEKPIGWSIERIYEGWSEKLSVKMISGNKLSPCENRIDLYQKSLFF